MSLEDISLALPHEEAPSWARSNWPALPADDLMAALDPMQMQVELKKAAVAKGAAPAAIDSHAAIKDSLQAMMLIRTYRVRGHLFANLDPLGLSQRDIPADLTPEYHGFTQADIERPIYLGGVLGYQTASITQIIATLRANYCGSVGLEYMHIADVEERQFLQERMEGKNAAISFTPEGKRAILSKVVEAENYERFCAKKYVGTKRFGLDGGEAMIPAMEAIIKYGGQFGVREIAFGMPHRGRLNMLANVMGKSHQSIFHLFAGGSNDPEDVGGSGDVKYHLGTSTDREFDGISVHMSLAANPSHLEAVDPIVLGKVRALQTLQDDLEQHIKVLPVLLHGDAAFAGQGIVWECFGMSGVRGYNTGGTLHFIVNNQIGFTTSPQYARSSPYPSDVAKGVQAPIFHVNGDDPEAVTFVCKMAIEFRQRFHRDIVIDMWCYRRNGHNEGDEPSFTQPLMYKNIRGHAAVSDVYAARLQEQGVIDAGFLAERRTAFDAMLEAAFQSAPGYKPNKADWFGGRWQGLSQPADPETARRNVETGIAPKSFEGLGRTLTTIPDSLAIHPTLKRVVEAKANMFKSGEGFDWATGEALAFGSLMQEGYGVRLSGQDCGRGTFSQRHAVWVDQNDEHKHIPLSHLAEPCGQFQILDSVLSEFGVLGFEYGYAGADPKSLVLWEAQFGDFANGAQVIFDQFIASAESKWLRANGLVVLLPHGMEGQGPEHSSARLERYLQLCAEDNIQVANCTTPANYFHILRRQMHRPFRKPLIMMTPKSLLRHKRAVSKAEDFQVAAHFMRILSDPDAPEDKAVERLVLCSGKVAYDLMDARDASGDTTTAIVRIEQLYPFPCEPLVKRLQRMTNLQDVVWAQEEAKNNGAWFFVESLIEACLQAAECTPQRARYAGRKASASPATGHMKRHVAEQAALVADALGQNVREEIRRQRKSK